MNRSFSTTQVLQAKHYRWTAGIILASGLIGAIAPLPVAAQIAPDNTLGNENSRVTRNVTIRGGNGDRIDGGAARGSNLFHSFSDFNVNDGQRVYFANPAGVTNILSRVTGNTRSDIQGTLGVDGSANLFLLNPNGIIFGPNAQLDISGSFTASTANSIAFPDGTRFSASTPDEPSLLSVAVPLGVQYGVGQRGDITNAGNLAVNRGQTLTLYGGTVRSSGSLTAPGGTVQVLGDRVALTDNARIDVAGETGGGTVLVGGDYRGQGVVPNALRTYVGSSVTINADALSSGNGGRVIVWADETARFYGNISARGGSLGGNGGFVEVSGQQNLLFDGWVDVGAIAGEPGQLLLDPENVIIENIAPGANDGELSIDGEILFSDPGGTFRISANALENALRTGRVTIEASNGIEVNNVSITATPDLVADPEQNGLTLRAGNSITLNQADLNIRGRPTTLETQRTGSSSITFNNIGPDAAPNRGLRSAVERNPGEPGDERFVSSAGTIRIITDTFTMNSNTRIDPATITNADAGDVYIEANNVTLDGAIIFNSLGANFGGGRVIPATGGGGTIEIQANTLNLRNGAQIQAIVLPRSQQVREPSQINIRANEVNLDRSQIFTSAEEQATGTGGNISITTNLLTLSNSSKLDAETRGGASGGLVSLQPYSGGRSLTVNVLGRNSQISASTSGSGSAGDMLITAPDSVTLTGGGFLSVQSNREATGGAGRLLIETERLTVSRGTQVSARTFGEGQGGTVFLRPNPNGRSLTVNVLGRNSQISASTSGSGSAGDMLVTAPDSITLTGEGLLSVQSNSDATGGAGRLLIETERLTVSRGTQVSARTFGGGQGGTVFLRPNPNGRSLTVNVSGSNSQISASTFGRGEGGDMLITAPDSVTLTGEGLLSVQSNSDATGGAGRLLIETERLTVSRGTQVSARTFGGGQGGTVFLRPNPNGRSLTVNLSSGSQISASTFGTSKGGDILITAPDSVTLTGRGGITTEATGTGSAGDLFVRTGRLNISNDVQVSAQASRSAAGNVTINARHAMVSGNASISASNASFRTSNTDANRFRGNVRLQILDTLVVNGGEITASTETGQAGSVFINAQNSVEISGNSRLAVEATGVGGQAGNLSIRTGRLALRNGSTATVESPNGQAGDLSIRANRVTLDNSTLNANAGAAGQNNANINLTITGPLMRMEGTRPRSQRTSTTRNALISANATGAIDGGNITINAENGFVLANANDNADITANATDRAGEPSGDGGRVSINTNAIFGLERRDQETPLSDITATSQSGNTGTIALNTLNVDPTRGLGELPVDLVDTASLVADGCVGRNRSGVTDQGEFIRTGRGGLSPGPDQPLTSETATDQLATLDSTETPSSSASIPDAPQVQSLVEAQGLGLNAEGKVSLMAGSSSTTTAPAVEQSSACRVSQL